METKAATHNPFRMENAELSLSELVATIGGRLSR